MTPKSTKPKPAAREGEIVRAIRDAQLSGVLIALAPIYAADQETLAEEIISAVGEKDLLRVAIAEEDYCLPQIRQTIRYIRSHAARAGAGKRGKS